MRRLIALLLACAAVGAHATQPTVFFGPLTLKLDALPETTALTVCTASSRNIATALNLIMRDNTDSGSTVGAGLDLDITLTRSPPQVGRLIASEFGTGTVLENSDTRIHVVGLFDPNAVLATLAHISTQDEDDVMTITICRPGTDFFQEAGCATLRNHLTVRQGAGINIDICRAPPVLLPADDLGDLPNDNVTPILAPRMTVATTAPLVSWYRNGVLAGTSAPVAGIATFEFAAVSAYGLYAYEVAHGEPAARSAPRYLSHHERIFRWDFEIKNYVP